MFDRITYISDDSCTVKLKENGEVTMNLMNLHLVFEDDTKKILAEVDDMDGANLKARFLGEIVGNRLVGGTIRKPSLDAKIRVIDKSEIPLITGSDTTGYMKLGVSPFYDDFPVFLDVNSFFSNHFAIFGNTGSGKSCGTTRLFQNMFHDQRLNPYKANIFIFDSSGEYYNAFSNLNQINNQYNYRYISTNETDGLGEKLRLPVYLLNKDDLALLLQCTSHSQLPIIERMLKLALVFSQNDMDSNAYKNHLIAKAIMTILYTNETAPNKRNEIFSILASCSTPEFNLEAPVQGIGYVRKFRECFLIDNSGNFTESVLMNEYLNSFIKEEYDDYEPHTGVFYDLNTLEKALNFTLISEGWLRNEQTYGDSVTLRVRLHSLIVGDNAKYFDVKDYVSLESFLSSLLITNGRKYQIVNINLNDIDDDFAKVLTKIYSRLIFDFSKALKDRGSIPFHIVLEEAHRYIQSDQDRFLFGYNIFERIAKEGRKYGVILGIITQRPVELSDNVISQCTNFLIFKINHPMDVDYMRKMIPHITDEIIEKQKALQAGTCLGFGLGFKIPLIVRMEMPNPAPLSGNCDVVQIWNGNGGAKLSPALNTSSAPTASNNDIFQSFNATKKPEEQNAVLSVTPEAKEDTVEEKKEPLIIPKAPATEEPTLPKVESAPSQPVEEPVPSSTIEEQPFLSITKEPTPENNSESFATDDPFLKLKMEASMDSKGEETENESPFITMNVDAPAQSVAPPTESEVPDKFDDSFVIREEESKPSFINFNSNEGPASSASIPEKPVSAPATAEEQLSNGISEIAEVNINSQGMLQQEERPALTTDMGEPLLELVDEDDDEGIDFE